MKRARLCALLGVLLVSCSVLTTFDEDKLTEDTFERCRDRTDNNNNGLVDCDDPSCSPFDVCRELTPDSCADGLDNDKDGLVDCADPGCDALPGVCTEQTIQACTDGKDNDGDGMVDCKDSGCRNLDVCRELSDADCSDGQDNDKDGLVDCNDFDCYTQPTCCNLDVPSFTGDTFDYQSACVIHGCVPSDSTCCQSGYQTCSPFDPQVWVAWGLPRAMQDKGALLTNEPCGCESSGVVSVESVPLASGTTVTLDLALTDNASTICGGFTVSNTFADDPVQCSGKPQPSLLIGVCLESTTDGLPRLAAMVDGQAQDHATLPGGGPVSVTIKLDESGALISGGALRFQAPSPVSALSSALVLAYGKGNGGRLERVTVSGPRGGDRRCPAPGDWYRHLARGEPVIARAGDLAEASDPTVVYQPELKSYIMLFVGRSKSSWDGIFSATSADGVRWTVSATPVIPTGPSDTTFGSRPGSPSLLFRDGRYQVWYTREDEAGGQIHRAIARASSTDGKTWKTGSGPLGQPYVLDAGKAPAWDSLEVYSPSVVETPEGGLLMLYTGIDAEPGSLPAIGLARSKDGAIWERVQQQPVIGPEPDAADLACEDPLLLYDSAAKIYKLWYTYRAFGEAGSIRYAASVTGATWSRWPTPVFGAGHLGTFDERSVTSPALRLEGTRLRMWYTGLDSAGVPQIGYAENRGGPAQ